MKKETRKNTEDIEVQEEHMRDMPENVIEDTQMEDVPEDNQADEKSGGDDVSKFEQEISATKDKLLRIMAEFENFKKRTSKEKEELFKMGVCETVSAILPVYDNLDRAIKASNLSEDDAFLVGIKMVQKQFDDMFEAMGVTAIKAVGEAFNPDIHNAVMHIEDENFGENEIAEELMRGYMYKDKVIRHSMVKVAN